MPSSSSSPYASAANILNEMWTTRRGLKSVVYNSNGELTCSKAAYAQCCHVLEHQSTLRKLLEGANNNIQARNTGLLYVLLYELVLGPNKSIRGGGALKRQLLGQETFFQERLAAISNLDKDDTNDDNSNIITIPRYVRVNTLKTTTREVIQFIRAQKPTVPVYRDAHVPDLLVLPPTPEARSLLQPLVSSHKVILQDKSSCFSALCLLSGLITIPPPSLEEPTDILDACAAPGNKTSHLAMLLLRHSGGTVHALDKSPDRFQLLQQRMTQVLNKRKRSNTNNNIAIQCHQKDFLETSPASDSALQHVRALLLDPSCSGSGMVSSGNQHKTTHRDPLYSNDRIQSLSKFQRAALDHAASKFPNVTRIVYSTCSLYVQENEAVIAAFLQQKHHSDWQLIEPPAPLSNWKRRGLPHADLTKEQSQCLLRVDPDQDATNGFFVACLEKRRPTSDVSAKHEQQQQPQLNILEEIPGLLVYENQFHNQGDHNNTSNSVTTESVVVEPTDKTIKARTQHAADGRSKKRAKKLEWKRAQREKKKRRLEAKTIRQNEG